MTNIAKKMKNIIAITGLSGILLMGNGCLTISAAVVSPITGAVDGAKRGYDKHPAFAVPGAIFGCAFGPIYGAGKGWYYDIEMLSHGFLRHKWRYHPKCSKDLWELYKVPIGYYP